METSDVVSGSGNLISRRGFLGLVLLQAGTAALLAACGQAPPAPAAPAAPTAVGPAAQATAAPATAKAPPDKRSLVISTGADITKLDPHLSTLIDDIFFSFNMFDTLTTRDPDLKLLPHFFTK